MTAAGSHPEKTMRHVWGFGPFSTEATRLVPLEGFEPPTNCLEDSRSIH